MPEQWTLLPYSWYNNDYQPAFLGGRSPLRRELQGSGCCSYYTVREIDTPFDKSGIEGVSSKGAGIGQGRVLAEREQHLAPR